MKAVVQTKYGPPDVLHPKEVEKPTPKADEILVRTYATSVNYGDALARNFKDISPREFNMPFLFWLLAKIVFGFLKPKTTILGSEFAGEIESVGEGVGLFAPGDEVFGYLGQGMGAYAEYVCVKESGCVATKPANMTYEEAAVVPYGAIMAFGLLRKANLQPGQRVLVNGASGAIGSAAAQLAKSHFGAEVDGVCSAPRLEYVKSLGADEVIDYTKEDFTENGETYDLIFDVLGKGSFSRSKGSLSQGGRHLFASFKTGKLFQMLWTSVVGGKRVICAIAPGSAEDLISVKELVEAGKIKALIDKRFPLEQAADAHRYLEEGHARGKVVITVWHRVRRPNFAFDVGLSGARAVEPATSAASCGQDSRAPRGNATSNKRTWHEVVRLRNTTSRSDAPHERSKTRHNHPNSA